MYFEANCNLVPEVFGIRDWDRGALPGEFGIEEFDELVLSKRVIEEKIDYLWRWTLPFLKQAAADFKFSLILSYPVDLEEEQKQRLADLRDQFEFVELVELSPENPWTHNPRRARLQYDELGAFFEISPFTIVMPGFFSKLLSYDFPQNEGAVIRFCVLMSAESVDGKLDRFRMQPNSFDSIGTVALQRLANPDPRKKRYKSSRANSLYWDEVVVQDRPYIVELRTTHSQWYEPKDWRVPAPRFVERNLPELAGLVARRNVVVHLDEARELEETPLSIDVSLKGPFEFHLEALLGEGISPKNSLVSFDFVNEDGSSLPPDLQIEGLAKSPLDSIGYFFYILSDSPGLLSIDQRIECPQNAVCKKIRILRWNDKVSSITPVVISTTLI